MNDFDGLSKRNQQAVAIMAALTAELLISGFIGVVNGGAAALLFGASYQSALVIGWLSAIAFLFASE